MSPSIGLLQFVLCSFAFQLTSTSNKINCPADETVFLNQECISCLSLKSITSFPGPSFSCPKELTFAQEISEIANRTLRGQIISVVTIQGGPFSKVFERPDGKTTYGGVVFEFLYAIEQKYNFTMNIFTSPDGIWGAETENGTWNGMIGVITKGEADLGASSVSITFQRSSVVDFTVSIHQEPTGILIPAPIQGDKLTVLILPLTPDVWLGIALSWAVFTPSYCALYMLSTRIHSDRRWTASETRGFLSKILEFLFGSLVQESMKLPTRSATCLLIPIWWMTTLILTNSYVAFLVSYLTVPKLYNLVNTLQELVQQRKLEWTFLSGTALFTLFKSNTSTGIYKAVGDGVSDADLLHTDFEGVNRVLTGKWAFIKERSFLDVALGDDFDKHRKCRLTLADQLFFKVGAGLAVQKKCHFLPVLDREILLTIATGVMEKWKTINWPKKIYCERATQYIIETQSPAQKLTLMDLQGAFFLICAGLIIALFSFIVEITLNSSATIANAFKRKLTFKTPAVIPKLKYYKKFGEFPDCKETET